MIKEAQNNEDNDVIVYTLLSKGGGVDGRDHTDKAGKLMDAAYYRQTLEKSGNRAWGDIVPTVVNLKEARRKALDKLDPIDKLILGLNETPKARVVRKGRPISEQPGGLDWERRNQ